MQEQHQEDTQQQQAEGENQFLPEPQVPQDSKSIAEEVMQKFNPFEKREEGSEIDIHVGEPQQKDETFTKYTVYRITGQDTNGAFDTFRRYSDFYELRRVLIQRWPGCFIPPIPPKKIGSNDTVIIDDRKRHLNYFCLKISLRSHLYYSEEFQQFLRSKEVDIGKTYEKMPKLRAKDIIERYREQYSQLNGKEITNDLVAQITTFSGDLKKAKISLSKYKDVAKQISAIKKQSMNSQTLLLETLLPDYEGKCLAQYTQGEQSLLIFGSEVHTEKLGELKKQIRDQCGINSFEFIYDMICFEYRDCEAFIEAIECKDFYEKSKSKVEAKIRDQNEELYSLQQGKKTFKSFFKGGDTESQKQKLELEIDCNSAEAKNISTLIDLITGILGFIEIEQFKSGKVQTYHKVLNSSSQLEVDTNNKFTELWKELGVISEEMVAKHNEEE